MSDRVLPFYLVCDQSFSMVDHIGVLDDFLRELRYAVGTDPVVIRKIRFCIVGFAGTAEVLLPLSELKDSGQVTSLTADAATSFGAAFTLLRDRIERDVRSLERAWHRVCRPAVFFLSDGRPTDSATWPAAHERLIDRSWPARPDIVAFGIGDVDPVTIGRIGTSMAFTSQLQSRPAALRAFVKALTESILRSGASVAEGARVALHVPELIAGFTRLDPGETR